MMPDIMMCDDPACDLAARCYRHPASGTKAHPHYQSWWLKDESSPRGADCPNFWERTPRVAAAHDRSIP